MPETRGEKRKRDAQDGAGDAEGGAARPNSAKRTRSEIATAAAERKRQEKEARSARAKRAAAARKEQRETAPLGQNRPGPHPSSSGRPLQSPGSDRNRRGFSSDQDNPWARIQALEREVAALQGQLNAQNPPANVQNQGAQRPGPGPDGQVRNTGPDGREYATKTYSYEYTIVEDFPSNQTPEGRKEINTLARKGMRTSQTNRTPLFQPGTHLDSVGDNVAQEFTTSRPNSPEREAVICDHNDENQLNHFLVPLTHEAGNFQYVGERIKVANSNFPGKELMKNHLFVFRAHDGSDLTKVGMYPRINVTTGVVYRPLNAPNPNGIDFHQTSRDARRAHHEREGR